MEGRASSDDSSSDDEHTWQEEQRKQLLTKKINKKTDKQTQNKPKFYEVKKAADFKAVHGVDAATNRTDRYLIIMYIFWINININ